MATNKAKEYLHIFAKGSLFFLALLLSIFIYFSIFNLSLSTDLFNDTKFWFCISNTLILIIAAADYGAFSPSEQKPETFQHNLQDYLSINRKQEKEVVIVVKRETPEEKLQIIPEEDKKRGFEKTEITTKAYRRSKSEKAKRAEVDGESKIMAMRRSKTVKREVKKECYLEENEFAEMTDEELNRRVEEFIQRFNRQIRLQHDGHGDKV